MAWFTRRNADSSAVSRPSRCLLRLQPLEERAVPTGGVANPAPFVGNVPAVSAPPGTTPAATAPQTTPAPTTPQAAPIDVGAEAVQIGQLSQLVQVAQAMGKTSPFAPYPVTGIRSQDEGVFHALKQIEQQAQAEHDKLAAAGSGAQQQANPLQALIQSTQSQLDSLRSLLGQLTDQVVQQYQLGMISGAQGVQMIQSLQIAEQQQEIAILGKFQAQAAALSQQPAQTTTSPAQLASLAQQIASTAHDLETGMQGVWTGHGAPLT